MCPDRPSSSPPDPVRVEQAARNNARWCDTVCRAHGAAGRFFDSVWVNGHTTPPFYPNMVTLRDTPGHAAAIRELRRLVERPLQGSWTVKDSYASLDLAPLGFTLLFDAAWLWSSPLDRRRAGRSSGIRWSPVASSSDLETWEGAWSGGAGNGGAPGTRRIFPSSLLADPGVVFLAGHRGRRLVAGGVASTDGRVVGLSNVFAPPGEQAPAWSSLLAHTRSTFPRQPVVGYEQDETLEAARAAGFEVAGPLRVWLRRSQ